jgi:predicted short-subunit dehydrogenase-like oxidoreductase (DUF2520 family)
MKTLRQAGLIVEGNSTRSVLLRLPGIAEEIGPIKSASTRVARRVSNFFRAGNVIENYEDFENCDLVLLRVPDESVTRIVGEISASQLGISQTSFVLCESWLSSEVLKPLSDRGGAVATVVSVPANARNWFAIEGDFVASKRVKRLLVDVGAHAIELRPGSKHLYFAATAFAQTLPRALFVAAQRALRIAGVSGRPLQTAIEEMAQGMFRDMSQGSRAGWSGPLLDCPESLAEEYEIRLRETEPALSAFLSEQLRLAKPFAPQRVARKPKSLSVSRSSTESQP